nr:MAG TPA: hypothetical protein [Caudoviricetes sp.]
MCPISRNTDASDVILKYYNFGKLIYKYHRIVNRQGIPLGILFFCQIRHGNIILITSITYKTMKEVHV